MSQLTGIIHLESPCCARCGDEHVLNGEELRSWSANLDRAIEDARAEGRATSNYIGPEPATERCPDCPVCEECGQFCELGAINLRTTPEPPIGSARVSEWYCCATCLTIAYETDAVAYAMEARRV